MLLILYFRGLRRYLVFFYLYFKISTTTLQVKFIFLRSFFLTFWIDLGFFQSSFDKYFKKKRQSHYPTSPLIHQKSIVLIPKQNQLFYKNVTFEQFVFNDNTFILLAQQLYNLIMSVRPRAPISCNQQKISCLLENSKV